MVNPAPTRRGGLLDSHGSLPTCRVSAPDPRPITCGVAGRSAAQAPHC
jgi:hypothetical protein